MAAGSMDAFDRLYRYFQPKVYHYILPFTLNLDVDARDIVQDIFVKLWAKREAMVNVASLEYYLYRMARNRLIDLRRSARARQAHYEDFTREMDVESEYLNLSLSVVKKQLYLASVSVRKFISDAEMILFWTMIGHILSKMLFM